MARPTDTDEVQLSSRHVCFLTGLSYRQLDYMARCGLVTPEHASTGSGDPRRWSPDQVRVIRLLATLRSLGATDRTVREAASTARDLPDEAWDTRVVVTSDGRFVPPLGSTGIGYLVDLARCADDTGTLAVA